MSAGLEQDTLSQAAHADSEDQESTTADIVRRRVMYGVLLGLAFLFGILGQYYFLRRREYLLDGVLFYAVAAVLFIAVVRVLERPAAGEREKASPSVLDRLTSWMRAHPAPATALALSLVCDLGAGQIARGEGGYWTGFWLWALSLGLFLAALGSFSNTVSLGSRGLREVALRRRKRLWEWLVAHRWELVALLGVTALAAGLRIYDLAYIPPNFGGDEGEMGLEARRVLAGERKNMFATGWLSHPTLFFFIQAFFLKFIDNSVFGLRLLSAVTGTLSVLALYFLVRELFDRQLGLLAATVLAGYHFHIHFSRLGVNNIQDTLFVSLVLLFFVRGTRTGSLREYGVAGLLAGISLYFYTGARLIPVIVVVYAVYLTLTEQDFLQEHLGGLGIFSLGLLLAVLPLAAFYAKFPDTFFARMNQVGIIQSGWLTQEQQFTGRSVWSLLFEQFKKSALAYNYYRDPTFWYRPGTPLLRFVSSVLFVFGLTYTTYRAWGDRRHFLVGAWFWLTVLLAGTLTENPPSSMRLVIVGPALAILIAIAVSKFSTTMRLVLDEHPNFVPLLAATFVFVVVLTSVRFYFQDYTPRRVYGNPTALIGTELSRYLTQREGDFKVYYFGPPFQYFDHGTIRFMTGDAVEGMNVDEPLQGPPDFIDRSRDALLVFVPARANELPKVRQWVPGGRAWEMRLPDGPLLFAVYEVPAS